MKINQEIFNRKFEALETYGTLDRNELHSFREYLERQDEWGLFRINPITVARELEIKSQRAIDIFVHGAKIGLFDFTWNLICPYCSVIEFSHKTVNTLQDKTFHCTLCDVDVHSDLDDQVEVSFTMNRGVAELEIDPYAGPRSYRNYFLSKNMAHSERLYDYLDKSYIGFKVIPPDDSRVIIFTTEELKNYRLVNLETHSRVVIQATSECSELPQVLDIDVLHSGFSPTKFVVPCGEHRLHIYNHSRRQTGISLIVLDPDMDYPTLQNHPDGEMLFLTGKMLLNNQSFRDLFRIQNLDPNLQLNIRSMTTLFTDLKGSTELYEKVGDTTAYGFVQEHFQILRQSVNKFGGAIVKTMGDAIMATFSRPADGFMAALDMLVSMNLLTEKWLEQGYHAGLKIGIHEGSTLAVNAEDRLDFFGQTINIAARIQGLADAGEILFSDSIYNSKQVQNYLINHSLILEKQVAHLKGVGTPTVVYSLLP